jgi:hypothetical protein
MSFDKNDMRWAMAQPIPKTHWQYFTEGEFRCKCGCGRVKIDTDFVTKLDQVRHRSKIPFRILSGYRCPSYNKSVGGAPTSAHMYGLAADIMCATSHNRWVILDSLLYFKFHRIGIADTFIHADDSGANPPEVIWLYN